VECPCRRCRRLFQPTVESLYGGSPYWWYCPACHATELQRGLRIQLTVAQGRAQLLRRRLGQASDPERVAADLEVLEGALAELRTVVGRLERVPAP
jgi:hypothetical protein